MMKLRADLELDEDEPFTERDSDSSQDSARQRPSGFQHRRPSEPPAQSTKQRSPAGWTVVYQYVRDGYRYQVIRRPIELSNAAPKLTKREEQVLAYACDGYSNKNIAYTLGLAPSTVGVLLFRAAGKMGVKSRLELLSVYASMKRTEKA